MLKKLTQDLQSACEISLRLPMTNRQYVIMADASFYAAGFVLMIQDYTQTANGTSEHKIYAPVSFGSCIFKPNQPKMSIYAKEFLAVHFARDIILWGCEKPALVLTDNRAVTRFFQTKIIPPTLWNALDHVVSFDIILGDIPGKANLAADYLSRIHINPKEKLTFRINSRIPISEVQIDTTAEAPDNSINTLLHVTSMENTRKHYLFQTVNKTDQTEINEEVHIQQNRRNSRQSTNTTQWTTLIQPDNRH